MNYKEIKQHNRRDQKLYWDSWNSDVCNWTYKQNKIDLHKFIIEEATSDEGMTKNHKSMFHYKNPNGLVAQLPEYSDFVLIDEPSKVNMGYIMYDQYENLHAKALRKYCFQRSGFTVWDVNYHIEALKEDIVEAQEFMIKHNLVGSLAA